MKPHLFATAIDDLVNQARREGMQADDIRDLLQAALDNIEDDEETDEDAEEKDSE